MAEPVTPGPARIGSLCSGYEGLGMAVQEVLGGGLAWVADNDEGAAAILAHRFPSVKNLGDITVADWAGVEPVDVLTAGFPCQDVSAAGKRAGLRKGNRSGVWIEVSHAIAALRPGLVVIENVRGLLTARGDEPMDEHLRAEAARDAAVRLEGWVGNELDIAVLKGDGDRVRRIRVRAARVVGARKRAVARCLWHERRLVRAIGTVLGSLADLGYDARWAVVSAADAGACHRRERVFIVAWPAADAGDGLLAAQRGGVAGRPSGGERGDPGADRRFGDRGHAPAADAEDWGQPQFSRGADGGECGQAWPDGEGFSQRPGFGAGDRIGAGDNTPGTGFAPAAAEDADGAAGGQRRLAAPGQTPGGRSRADAGRPGGVRAAADPPGDGRDEGRPEPAGIVGGPDAAERGDGLAADTDSGGRGSDERDLSTGKPDTARLIAADTPGVGHGHSGQEGERRGPSAAVPGAPADAEGAAWGEPEPEHLATVPGRAAEPGERPSPIAWGAYEPAIRRWEAVTGRPAPPPTEPGRTGQRLSPRFVEWMQGLPEGWVTGVPGLSRNQMLKALGNGVVPQQAAMALRLLLPGWLEAAA